MSSQTERSLPLAPPPWACKATIYALSFYHSASTPLPSDVVYDPHELHAPSFSSEKLTGEYVGGLGFAQILRYSETPVGPYDELVIMPGYFSTTMPDGKKSRDSRITGIWVSQETTTMNGRRNWNIPKHLARFNFTPTSSTKSSPIKIEVYRMDPSATKPFFSATIQPISYIPAFPLSSSWISYLGLPTRILQPPLPEGDPADVIVGTTDWKRSIPVLKSKRAKMVWIDMKQSDAEDYGNVKATDGHEGDSAPVKGQGKRYENWWPGWKRRWHLGIACEDATLELGKPEVFTK